MSSIAHWTGHLAPAAGMVAGLVALAATLGTAAARNLRVPRSGPEPEWWPEFERQLAEHMTSRRTDGGVS